MVPEMSDVMYLVGQDDIFSNHEIFAPYDELVCDFLNNLSNELLSDMQAKKYPDVMYFAFWCRKANIERKKRAFLNEPHSRLGLGMVFHIAPSNVPINFAFSYAFSLLAGNRNIVRVPTKAFPQTSIICGIMNRLFADKKYIKIAGMTAFIKYEQNDDITSLFSSKCNARVIWGGDQTIKNIRKLAIPERSIEVLFADRYSFCMIDEPSINRADDATLDRLANSFYNDTYLMDQNACSSPHLIIWLNGNDDTSDSKERFWNSVYKIAKQKYELQPVVAMDKYVLFCENSIELDCISGFEKHGNFIYRIELDDLPADIDTLRGKGGFFYEYSANDINNIAHIINTKYQTLTYFGLDKKLLIDFVTKNHLSGIDRIVPIGSALDIDIIWDGYDVVRSLSRIIDVR